MGQQVTAILYGARVDYDDCKGPANTWTGYGANELHRSDYDDVFGFAVAIGAGSIDGVPGIEASVPLNEIWEQEPFKASFDRAKQNWELFLVHAQEHGVKDLPGGEAWLVVIEVA
jgi:hypothetical protein